MTQDTEFTPQSIQEYTRLVKGLDTIKKFRTEENLKPNKPWGVCRSDYVEYCQYLNFDTKILENKVAEIRRRKQTVLGLDLLASTTALESLEIGGIAVGLGDPRDQEEKEMDEGRRSIVTTNLLTEKKRSWKLIEEMMSKMEISSFDLILQRGVGGLESIGGPLRRMYHL